MIDIHTKRKTDVRTNISVYRVASILKRCKILNGKKDIEDKQCFYFTPCTPLKLFVVERMEFLK